MGLLATNGGKLIPGANWYWYPRTIVLKLSHTNLNFLQWLMDYFSPLFTFTNTPKPVNATGSRSFRVISVASELAIQIWAHWNDESLNGVLPHHFSHSQRSSVLRTFGYFSLYTLAFWAMQSGKYSGNYFYIQVSMLEDFDKEVLMTALKEKCGLDSKLTMKGTKLAISNPVLVVEKLRPKVLRFCAIV